MAYPDDDEENLRPRTSKAPGFTNPAQIPSATSTAASVGAASTPSQGALDAQNAVGASSAPAAQSGGQAVQDAKEWVGDAAGTVYGWGKDAVGWAGNALDDMFSAETVHGPEKGEWGSTGTRADAYNNDRMAEGADRRGVYNGAAGGYAQQGTNLQGQAQGAGQREAPDANWAGADHYGSKGESARNTSASLLNDASQSAGQDRQLDALNRFAARTQEGPSAAEVQLQQQSDANQRAALGMARSGRGAGDSASALSDAMMSNAATQQTTNANAATLRAQEEANRRAQQLQALEAAMGGASAIRGSDLAAYNGSLGIRGQDLQSQQLAMDRSKFDVNADLQQQQVNDQMRLGLGNQALGYGQLGLGYNQLGESTNYQQQQLGQHAYDQQAQYELEQQRMALDAAKANQSADLEKDGGVIGMVGSAAGSLFSDERAKEDVEELEHANGALSRALGRESLDTVRNARGYSYRYKDPSMPGAKRGRMVGPMAQDIERGPLGDTLVEETPQGKMVNTGRLTMVNSSAIAQQQDELDEQNEKIRALQRALGRKAA